MSGSSGADGPIETSNRINRRRFLRLTGAAGVALLCGGTVLGAPASAAESEYKTITSLNLRAKPSSKGKVLVVMPAGSVVSNLGYAKNGYIKVDFQGTAGWAKAAYLGPVNPALNATMTGEGVTTSAANLRQGPSTGDTVLLVVPAGSTIETSDSAVDGFRFVSYEGTEGWLFDDYIGASVVMAEAETYLTVMSSLNLRAQPNTGAKVLKVLATGTTVLAKADRENGFRSVVAGGVSGWAYEAYLG